MLHICNSCVDIYKRKSANLLKGLFRDFRDAANALCALQAAVALAIVLKSETLQPNLSAVCPAGTGMAQPQQIVRSSRRRIPRRVVS